MLLVILHTLGMPNRPYLQSEYCEAHIMGAAMFRFAFCCYIYRYKAFRHFLYIQAVSQLRDWSGNNKGFNIKLVSVIAWKR